MLFLSIAAMAQLALTFIAIMEIKKMRASTQHLLDAVSVLAASVQVATDTIKSELDKLAAANADGDDEAVESAVTNIKGLTGKLGDAVTAAQTAVSTVPPDAGATTAPAPADPAAPVDQANPGSAPQTENPST